MVPHTPPTVETLTRLAYTWNKPLNLDACPAPTSLRRFCGATGKPNPAWFWGRNQEAVAMILRSKSPNRSRQFWGQTAWNHRSRFYGQTARNYHHRFWGPNRWETVRVVSRPNHSQTVDLDFEAQLRNMRSLSLCARCRSHTAPPDLSIVRPPSTWPVWPFPILCIRFPTPVMILVATLHDAHATCTPLDKQTRFSKWTKGKR
jgi:hypothetical protein